MRAVWSLFDRFSPHFPLFILRLIRVKFFSDEFLLLGDLFLMPLLLLLTMLSFFQSLLSFFDCQFYSQSRASLSTLSAVCCGLLYIVCQSVFEQLERERDVKWLQQFLLLLLPLFFLFLSLLQADNLVIYTPLE